MLQTSQISAGQNLQALASTRPQWFRRGNFNRDHRMLQPKSIQLNYGYPTCAGIVDSLLYSNMLEYMQHIADAKKTHWHGTTKAQLNWTLFVFPRVPGLLLSHPFTTALAAGAAASALLVACTATCTSDRPLQHGAGAHVGPLLWTSPGYKMVQTLHT